MPASPQYFSPLNIAAYLTWLAIASEPVAVLLRGPWPPTVPVLAGSAALCAVLLLFVAREASRTRSAQQLRTLAQIPFALGSFAVFDQGLQPVLLILVAAQAAQLFSPRQTLWVMGGANLCMTLMLFAEHNLVNAVVSTVAYLGFQGFAALSAHAMNEAQQARDEAQRINAELLATRALLAEGARADERLHLSRELHDLAGHKLTALKLQLGLCAAGHGETVALVASRQLADELLADVRGVVGALRAHDGVDLHSSLAALASGIPHPRITLDLDEAARPADFARAQALLRAAQEGATNALRHAGATTLHICLRREAAQLQLRVQDNGCGPGQSLPGNGLTGLQERLAAVGGSLHFGPGSTSGSCLIATVPA